MGNKMNLWWPVLIVLGCSWIVPLLGARQAGIGWAFFVGVGSLWTVVCFASRLLYDLGIQIRKKLGLTALADWGERVKSRILSPARVALLIMASMSFIFAML